MPPPASQLPEVRAAMQRICAGLDDAAAAHLQFDLVDELALPSPYRGLLAHKQHMTSTLREHYGGEIALQVLAHCFAEGWYRRVIQLTLAATGAIVELGIVAMDLGKLPSDVQESIRERKRPLGDILMASNLLREITPRWFVRIPGSAANLSPWRTNFDRDIFGRVGVMHVDRHPAIELLEIVTGVDNGFV